MGFSKRLKLLRKNADVTQDELAQYLQVSRSTIAGYETKNRQPDYDKLYMIAQFFSCQYRLSHFRQRHPPGGSVNRRFIYE